MATRKKKGKSGRRPASQRKKTASKRRPAPKRKKSASKRRPIRQRKKGASRRRPAPQRASARARSRKPIYRPLKFGDRLVVKFKDELNLNFRTDGWQDKEHLGPWNEIEQRFGRVKLRRMFTSVKPERIIELGEKAKRRNPNYRQPNFLHCFLLELQDSTHAQQIERELRSWQSVDYAYVDHPTVAADSVAECNEESKHLKPGPVGIGAHTALGVQGGDGAGQHLIDIETGWTLNHKRLPLGIQHLHGFPLPSGRRHGTAVLGVVCGKHFPTGCKGIAPKADVGVVSLIEVAGANAVENLGGAILFATHVLHAINVRVGRANGGVLLIEHIIGGNFELPPEWQMTNRQLIEQAVSNGITVIEAAGNGSRIGRSQGANLDQQLDNVGSLVTRGPQDSGAIIVGAALAVPNGNCHDKTASSNFGDRVDCYAWGQSVVTPTSTVSGSITVCNSGFGGTSAAAAIVAGVALVLQGVVAIARPNQELTPAELRGYLTDANLNTPCCNPIAENIGVMPNLANILAAKPWLLS